jgi:hypothetical protein
MRSALQILKDALPLGVQDRVPVAALGAWENAGGQALQRALQAVGRRLELSVIPMLLREATAPEYQGEFAEIAPEGPDALVVNDVADHFPYRPLIVGPAEKSRLPALGDSLTDGNISTIDAFCRSPDQLARRLAQRGGRPIGVMNNGLGGNRILHDLHAADGRAGAQPRHQADWRDAYPVR